MPPETATGPFVKRLLEIGESDPGQILLATSDQTAWLYAESAALLEPYFRLYQPSLSTVRSILDKELFAGAATRAGVGVLPTWSSRGIDELAALAKGLPYPVLIKPRTHVHRLRKDKGLVVHSPGELLHEYPRFAAREAKRAAYTPLIPDAGVPLLQAYAGGQAPGIHSITGFLDRTGELFVTRHSVKVLQRSQPVGVGVCFESAPPNPALSAAVRRLCRELGYFGIFEVEFVWSDGRWNVIDFNSRLFSQIGLDIRRGMPLPLLACLDAAGETAALRAEVAKAQQAEEDATVVFYDHFTLRALLMARRLTSRLSRAERAYWRDWVGRHAARSVDFAADRADPLPGIVHALSELYLGLKAVPKFLRSTPRLSRDIALDRRDAA
jgi:predicted ATP-grasp superfamily ATP-dependent carboligase